MTLEHLRRARDELIEAREKEDGLGTGMMINEAIKDLDRLIENTEEIKDASDGEGLG